SGTGEKRKTRARDLGRTLKIQDAERRAEVPMCFGLKVKLGGFSKTPDFNVLFFALTDRHIRVGEIRNSRSKAKQFVLGFGQGLFDVFELLRYRLNFVSLFRGVDFLLHELGNALGSRVTNLTEALGLKN